MKAFLLMLILLAGAAHAQTTQKEGTSLADIQKIVNDTLASKWYERIQLRGYADFRYNRSLESNNKLTMPASDKSVGNNKGFYMRRARLTFFGEINDRVFIYIQPDYSQDAGVGTMSQNYLQIRDAYFDYAISEDKEWRVRSGITKVPYGFENLQSSSNRAPMDRSDALNSGVPNERDTGVFLMYASTEARKRFKELTQNNLKGSGDYGLVAVGVYNGQTLNRPEENNDLHRVIRATYPFKLASGQFIEASLQAYEGKYRLTNGVDVYDQRSAASFVYYPQPFGFQAEWTVGQGPDYDRASNSVRKKNLQGGYAMVNYNLNVGNHRFFPFVRYQTYKGGRKLDNGNHMATNEWEAGTEWQPNAALELTIAYANSNRVVESAVAAQNYAETGRLLRLQAQFNY